MPEPVNAARSGCATLPSGGDVRDESEPMTVKKVSYIGAPAVFALELAAKTLRAAFREEGESDHIGIYIVGSSLERAD